MSIYSDAVLILKPSGYKAAELYSVVPNTSVGDFDVARSSTTTRRNASGYIEDVAANVPRLNYDNGDSCPYLLTEAASTNLITYPISFGNPYWTKSGAGIIGDETNKTTVYSSDFSAGVDGISSTRVTSSGNNDGISDGATSYDDVLKSYASVDNATHYIYKAGMITTNVIQKISWKMYIPSANTNVNDLRITNGGSVFHYLKSSVKKVIDGTDLGAYSAAGGYITGTEGFWVEVILWVEEQSAAGTHIRWQLAKDAAETFVGAGSSADDIIYFRDFLVEDVGGFDAPKVDGNGDLEREAYKLVEDTSTGTHQSYSSFATGSSGNNYTTSFFVKAAERSWCRISNYGGKSAYFDLENGVVGTETNASGKIEALSNGWYRISITYTSEASERAYIHIADADNSISYQGQNKGIYIAYAQMEESDYVSSLMLPTTEGSTTSRVGDAITGGGNSSLFSGVNSSGTLYAEIAALSDDLTERRIALTDGTVTNRVDIQYNTGSNSVSCRLSGSVVTINEVFTLTDITVFNKIAVRWSATDVNVYINGVSVFSNSDDYSFTGVIFDGLSFSSDYAHSKIFYGKTKAIAVFDYLSDDEMETLTT